MSPRHAKARWYAENGYPVFPCTPNAKTPATANGFKDATTDLAQIDAWWSEADYNIGLCPEDCGWCVIDLDPGAEEHWIALLKQYGLHELTYQVTTPRDGRHIYFAGSLPASASKLGPHIDTRGRGSYVLVPPSVVDGKPYEVTYHGREIAVLPAWIAVKLASKDHRVVDSGHKELDTPSALVRAGMYLDHLISRGDVAVSGRGGNDRTYQLALELRDYGVSDEACLRLLLEPKGTTGLSWNERCIDSQGKPYPWDEDELRGIIANAYKYAQNKEAGAWQTRSLEESFAGAQPVAAPSGAPAKAKYALRRLSEFRNQPEPQWIVPEMIPERSTILFYAPTRSFKSFIVLDLLLKQCAAGHQCIYAAGEGLYGIEKTRSIAWQAANGVADDKLDETFFTTRTPPLGMVGEGTEFVTQLVASGVKPRLIVLDTAGAVMAGLDINKPADVTLLTRFCEALIEQFGCSVFVVHHVSDKPGARERGPAGSYAFIANFDVALELHRIAGDAKAVEVWVRKMKDAPERPRPWTYKLMPYGQSLVPTITDEKEHKRHIEDGKTITPAKVGKALRDREAVGIAEFITTAQLAVELLGPDAMEDKRLHKHLDKLAKKELRPYCQWIDDMAHWYLDPQEAPQ